MAPNCASLKCFGCDDVLCSKEDVSASVQPSSPQVVILKAAASSVQGAERCTALVWIGPLRGCSLSPWFRPVQGCRNRWCPELSLQLPNQTTFSQWLKLSKDEVLKLFIATQLWENAGMERDRKRQRGREDWMSACCLHPSPAAWRRHLKERGRWGVKGDRLPYAESAGPEVCEECEWYAWVDSFRARRGDGSRCHLLWTLQAHSNSISGMGLLFFFFS